MKLLAMGRNLTDPQICLLIGENIPTHRHHQDSYDESKVEEEDDDEEDKDETVGDQSVLKYHISLPAEKIAGGGGAKNSRFDFEQIDDEHPSDAHGRIWRSRL